MPSCWCYCAGLFRTPPDPEHIEKAVPGCGAGSDLSAPLLSTRRHAPSRSGRSPTGNCDHAQQLLCQRNCPKRVKHHWREIMRVHVDSHAGGIDIEKPKRICLDGRRVEVIENVDQWFGPDYRYFKVKGDDGNLYILRFDETRDAWELTM